MTGPGGVQVVIPAGALDSNTVIGITRSSAGAPAPLQAGNAPAGPIYEFTPHDIVFNTPVTIRLPIPPGAVSSQVFMASLGGNWAINDATVVGGFAEFQRNGFSFGMTVTACTAPSSDPYPCWYPGGRATVTANPVSAITQVSGASNSGFNWGLAGSWRVNHHGTVTVTMEADAPPDCNDPRVSLTRVNLLVPPTAPNRRQPLLVDVPLAMTLQPIILPPGVYGSGGTMEYLHGSMNVDVSSHLTDVTNSFLYSFSCRRPAPYWTGRSYGEDHITITGPMTPPSGPFTIGGNVSGLANGATVELQNNGGDNLQISANGSFTFATPLPIGASYNVTVLTQPSGQTCIVQNGSGTVASANVTNVVVTCTSSGPGLALVMGQNNLSIFRRDISTGELTPATPTIVGAQNGTDIALTPDGRFAYVLNGGSSNASVSLYSIDSASGVVAPLTAQPSLSGLSYPNDIVMDPLGRFIWIASWNAAPESVRTYSVNSSTGELSFRSSIGIQQYALAAHPTGNYVYGVNLNTHTISGYSVDQSTGALTLLPGSPLSTGPASSPFRIAITPDGRFAYVANQGSSTIAIFSIDVATGALASAGSVSTASGPYGIRIHPNGRYLYVAEESTNQLEIYAINSSTGALTSQGFATSASFTPYDVAVTTTGDFLYVVDRVNSEVSAFSIDSSTGNLTLLPGQPISVASYGALAIAVTP